MKIKGFGTNSTTSASSTITLNTTAAVVLPKVILVWVVLGVAKKKKVEKLSAKRDKFGLLVHWRLDRQLQTREQENNIVI